MTVEDLIQFFEDNEDNNYTFDQIENKRSTRPDLHAMVLLDVLCPGTTDMVSAAEHDEIWFDADLETVAANATEADLMELIRCGVRVWDEEAFALFV